MGYYGNNDRFDRRGGGDYGRGGGYGGRGGWGRGGGWDNGYGGGYDRNSDRRFRFEIGEKVIHAASGLELSVISYGREQLECRKPDLTTGWFYEHELEPISNGSANNAPTGDNSQFHQR